jgi:hypothetical protein
MGEIKSTNHCLGGNEWDAASLRAMSRSRSDCIDSALTSDGTPIFMGFC